MSVSKLHGSRVSIFGGRVFGAHNLRGDALLLGAGVVFHGFARALFHLFFGILRGRVWFSVIFWFEARFLAEKIPKVHGFRPV